MKVKLLLPFFCMLLIPFLGQAQAGQLFSTDTELSSSLINQLYQDSKGYIWIATEDGLDRYDGAKFSIYKQNRKDSTSILNNYVKSIFEDSEGILYFGFFNGLQYFDHATEKFHQIPLILENNDTYPAHVTSLIEKDNGDILISTSGQGIFLLEKSNSDFKAKKINTGQISLYINSIFEDSRERLWILTQDNGLYRVSKEKTDHYFNNSGQETIISSICEDKNGKIYAGSLTRGLFQLDENSNSFKAISGSEKLPVNELHPTRENKIMVGTDGKGLKIYDPVNDQMSVSDFSISNFDFSKTKVHSIIEDRTGNLWLGIYQKGVLLIPNKANNFEYLGYQSLKNNVIGSNSIMSVYKDQDNILWVGTDGDGIYGIDENNRQKFHYTNPNNNYDPSTILSITEDSYGELWIGTYLNGLAKLDKETGQFDYFEEFKDADGNFVERVYSIKRDSTNKLWIGSLGYGLFLLDLESERITDYNSFNQENYDFLRNKWINCLLVSRGNKVYIGTFDGLSVLDTKNNTYLNENGATNILLSNKIIYSLYEDEELNLWIGTSEGLYLKPFEEEIIKNYTTEDGLPSNLISAIEKDDSNQLWISTNNGISKFNPEGESFTNFYFRDGLQGNEFNKNASFSDNNNQLYFGSTNGVTFFHPSEITSQENTVDLKITAFYIQNEAVKKGMKSGKYDILNKNITEANTINLSHRDNDFSLEFSSLAYKNQEWITYSYTMNDESWVKLRPGINTVTFNDLEPGTYNFKVKAKDYGDFSEAEQLKIIIHPPWYFSTWAKIGYFLLLAIIAYFVTQEIIHRRKTKKKLQEHRQAEQINEAKLQFLTNISHDIKTPISLITNPLKKLIKIDQHEERQKLYQIMERNSDRILHLIDQLINARKFDKGQISLKFSEVEIIKFVKSICSLFEDQTENRNIKFQIFHKQPEIYGWIDPNHFDKIIQNVISNAIKFTPENGEIDVTVIEDIKQGHFKIIVKDNGIGIKESEINDIFNRFYRVATTDSPKFEGTGIGLHLTKSIAELHHGNITVENNIDQDGCQFIISIPLGKAHLKDYEISLEAEPVIKQHAQSSSKINKENHNGNQKIQKNKHTVLIVDDDAEIRNYIADELSSQYNTVTSASGKKAFPLVLKQQPDLIISDVMMPEMNGITFSRKVKKNININHIPIILLTAKTDKDTNLEGLEIGADAYMNKPFNIEILKKTAKNLIKNRDLLKNTYSGNQSQDDKIEKIELKSADETLLEKFMNVVNKNISNSELNVEMIASELGISRVHLYRKLKQLTNQSAGELITNVRLKQAGNLLISKNMNISEVAYAVGFSSTSKFSTKFKEFYGMPPSIYRDKNNK